MSQGDKERDQIMTSDYFQTLEDMIWTYSMGAALGDGSIDVSEFDAREQQYLLFGLLELDQAKPLGDNAMRGLEKLATKQLS